MGSVDALQIGRARVKVRKKVKEVKLDDMPVCFVEGWAQAVRAWARVILHCPKGLLNLVESKGLREV